MVTVSLFSFIKNLQRNPKSTTKLGEERIEPNGGAKEGQKKSHSEQEARENGDVT